MSFYITTPIYYVNGAPHIGHAYTTIAADAVSRYQRSKGLEVRFLTGVDEHGQKVLKAAEARGLTPQAHCDDLVVVWKQMMANLDITYDRFIRTTDDDHQSVVKAALNKLWKQDLIYQDTYTGWYSTAAERFWTEKDLVDGKCPDTGQAVEEITETNYFFKMGQYQARLIQHISDNPGFIQPVSRQNEVLGFLRRDLNDLCISRPKSRMSWGIPLPFDEEYVTYVWFDALLNYLTGTGYHPDGDDSYLKYWPVDFHLLGKDILTTHAVYWSTLLMALEVPLPKHFYAHGWWTVDGQKMSKSLGNTIDVGLLSECFGVDAARYFFLREISFGADGGFSYDGFLTRYNADLANDLGNMAHRGLSMTTNWLGAKVPQHGPLNDADLALRAQATQSLLAFDNQMEGLQFNKALDALWDLVRAGNKYIDSQQPWALNKAGDTERLATVMRHVLEVCFFVGVLLRGVMPHKSVELLTKLGRSEEAAQRWLTDALAAKEANLDALPAGLD
ncbi:MAG: methionine--tRNA ligase, partial [Rhodobacterales bacterium]|nr:methionine--tRNA ligase [Rhodobacterales bacterium]